MTDKYWRKPQRWNRQAEAKNKTHKVFCGSMCDWADNNAPEGQRGRLWQLIRDTPHLTWQLLTKRGGNIHRFLPDDWGTGYPNVWLGVTVEDQKHGFPRIEHLREIPATVRFLSMEPLLEPVGIGYLPLGGIHWVIVGGESGPNARPMMASWVTDIQIECIFSDVPFFFKQWGGRKDKGGCLIDGAEVKEWPRL
jgi:protein gp37